ncbi:MAG: c-type cytochrome biogenesis protein CcmI, partial [Pseudomonadota bacterium]|nr:c-type cytochrome biogenesis protein CcmI [Pseudomonadota bacterium]
MIKLYLAMAVLLIIAVIIVLLAGLRQRRQSVDRESENRDWYEERLAELEQDKQQQRISQEAYNEAKLELDKTFISDSRDIEGEVSWKRANPFIPIAIILAVAVGFYAVFGSWSLQKQADDALAQLPELGQRLLQEQQQADVESMQTFALGMRQKLAAKPDDPMAWWLY